MNWMLALYPAKWRRRYGDEFLELMATERFSIGTLVDVLAGAIDAWIEPQEPRYETAVEGGEKGTTMLGRMMKLSCAGHGPQISRVDVWKSAGVMIGGTLALTILWMTLHFRMGDNSWVNSLSPMPFFIPLLASMKFTQLKDRSRTTQLLFIGGGIAVMTVFFLAVGWVAGKL